VTSRGAVSQKLRASWRTWRRRVSTVRSLLPDDRREISQLVSGGDQEGGTGFVSWCVVSIAQQ